jgi:phage gp45-like
MHRATPSNSSFRAYSAGGARALLSAVDDSKLMQEIAGSFMKGESRGKIEAPHSYGFTAVPFDPDKGEDGKDGLGPETFISFMGGNRSFPVAGPIDDRRHRLKGLEKGDVALFRGKDDGQQFHMNGIGSFLSTYPGKKLRLQVVQKLQEAAQGGARAGALAEAGAGANGGQAGAEGQEKPTGQKAVYKNESKQFFEVTGEGTESMNKKHTIVLDDGETAVHLVEEGGEKKVYLGGLPEKGHKFGKVLTEGGVPSLNVYARIPD